ncbi:MAG: carotenoid 1,2-hydratase [Pseudomonadota bacterium]
MARRGYRWWYLDGTSADGAHHVVVIAFVGSVFSPFYARAAQRGAADPSEFCAFNVGLYNRTSRHTWVFSEYQPTAISRSATAFGIGANQVRWDGERLRIAVDDRSAPLQQSIKGTITARPRALTERPFRFGRDDAHRWWPVAPILDLAVDIDSAGLHWQGRGYTDMNDGAEPLHEGFDDWHWCRWHDDDVSRIQYRARHSDGETTSLDLSIDPTGAVHTNDLPGAQALRRSGWGIAREQYGAAAAPRVATLDDTPFYARSLLLRDGTSPVMHESLSLTRFRRAWVRQLLPFRMRFPIGRLFR